jgi:hypothetical protein
MRHELKEKNRVSKPQRFNLRRTDLKPGQCIILVDKASKAPVISLLVRFLWCTRRRIAVIISDDLLGTLYCGSKLKKYPDGKEQEAVFYRRDFHVHDIP